MSPNCDFYEVATSAAGGLGWFSWSWFTPTLVTALITSSLTALCGLGAWLLQRKHELKRQRQVLARAISLEIEQIAYAATAIKNNSRSSQEIQSVLDKIEHYTRIFQANINNIGIFSKDEAKEIMNFYLSFENNLRLSYIASQQGGPEEALEKSKKNLEIVENNSQSAQKALSKYL